MFCVSHCETGHDLAPTQGAPNGLGIVGPVRQQPIWAAARPATRALERREGIEQG